jgi:hypothetical protein
MMNIPGRTFTGGGLQASHTRTGKIAKSKKKNPTIFCFEKIDLEHHSELGVPYERAFEMGLL